MKPSLVRILRGIRTLVAVVVLIVIILAIALSLSPSSVFGDESGMPARGRARSRESERSTRAIVVGGPQLATMTLDDGATDREANTHAVGFSREEYIEQFAERIWLDADTRVAHRQTHRAGVA